MPCSASGCLAKSGTIDWFEVWLYLTAIALKSELSTRALSIHTPLREDVNNAGPEIMARIKQLHAETKSNGEHYTQDDLAALRDGEQERLDLTNPVDEGVLTRYKDLNGRVSLLFCLFKGSISLALWAN